MPRARLPQTCTARSFGLLASLPTLEAQQPSKETGWLHLNAADVAMHSTGFIQIVDCGSVTAAGVEKPCSFPNVGYLERGAALGGERCRLLARWLDGINKSFFFRWGIDR